MKFFTIVFLGLFLFIFSSCQLFSEKQQAHLKAPDQFQRLENKVVLNHKSFNAQFFNEKHIIYLKNQSPDHDETQVYLKSNDKNQKLTHLKGHNFLHKPFQSEDNFIFMSDNESEKFNLSRIQQKLEQKVKGNTQESNQRYYIPFLPKDLTAFNFDIYRQNITHYKQTRLTTQITPDLWPVNLEGHMFFSRKHESYFQIYQLHKKNGRVYRKTNSKTHHTLLSAREHLVAWSEYDNDWNNSTLVVAPSFTSKPVFKLQMNQIQSLDVHPNKKLILVSAQAQQNQHELYVVDLDKSCLQRLSYLKSNEYWPSWHPAGQKFIYTSDLNNQLQVYESQFFADNSCTQVSGNL